MFWREKPNRDARWIETAGGDAVPEAGPCPDCEGLIVYNGNYFCSSYEEGSCQWALEHPATTTRDREVCDNLGIGYL